MEGKLYLSLAEEQPVELEHVQGSQLDDEIDEAPEETSTRDDSFDGKKIENSDPQPVVKDEPVNRTHLPEIGEKGKILSHSKRVNLVK